MLVAFCNTSKRNCQNEKAADGDYIVGREVKPDLPRCLNTLYFASVHVIKNILLLNKMIVYWYVLLKSFQALL